MTVHPPLRIGIVGCGDISHAHGRAAISISEKVKIVSCCDVREEVAQAWAHRYGCESHFTDYVQMAKTADLDAILLATWPSLHRDQVEQCLAAGIRDILCEKALTVTAEEALGVWQAVREADAVLLEGFTYLHHPRMRKLAELRASEDWGSINSVHATFSLPDREQEDPSDANRNWRQRPECAGGIPWDFACYSVNASNWMAGSVPVRAYCIGAISRKYGTINRMHGMIEYENGCIGFIESDKQSGRQDLNITFTEAMVDLPNGCWDQPIDGAYEIHVRHDTYQDDRQIVVTEPGDRFAGQLQHFVDVVRGEAQPLLTLAQSVTNMYTLDALLCSMDQRQPRSIRLPQEIMEELEP